MDRIPQTTATSRRFCRARHLAAACLLLVLAACQTSPPVQEMSDARQAIAVARDAGAEELAAEQLQQAIAYLESAEQKISERKYNQAKRDALDAKESALNALSVASVNEEE